MPTLTDAPILSRPQVFTADFCRDVIDFAMPHLVHAKVGPAHKRVVNKNARTAFSAILEESMGHMIQGQAIAAAGSLGTIHRDDIVVEDVEVVMYPPGGKFLIHHDGDHRSHSFLVNLNEGFSGGELVFPQRNIQITPSLGRGTVWANSVETQHRSDPVTQGCKWIAITWIRSTSRA